MTSICGNLSNIVKRNLRSVVYGGTDGIISMFAVVSSTFGAHLSMSVIIIIGLASIFADALSMATSDYMSNIAEKDMENLIHEDIIRDYEDQNVREEVLEIIRSYKSGYSKAELETVTNLIIRNKKLTSSVLLSHQKYKEEETEDGRVSAITTFISFICFGLVPLTSTIISSSFMNPFISACIFTMITLFILGWLRAKFTNRNPLESGFHMVCLGGATAIISYFVALLLSKYEESYTK